MRGRRAGADAHASTPSARRSCSYGTDEQKRVLPAEDPRRRHPLLHRLQRARRRHRPRRLKTRAVRDGDEYVINGQKMWTSLASDADYCWLAVRTNPEVAKHKGISIIIVPMDTPGITIQPLHLMGEHDINAVFFDDVRVPGQEPRRRGERRLEADHQPAQPRARHAVLDRRRRAARTTRSASWAQETKLPDGRRVIDQEWVQINLARVHAKLEFLRLINWKVAWTATQGTARRRPTRRRSRCSAPSSTSRRSGC